ncbi:S9 family peptidase [Amycolatopsis saalfeldensis]|uniref:Prolyl oligopeptidase family protein n=1 Tax=Amycolatopsis saalfeldensis TaxID=394193 RepID=A0A1H8QNY7_9PSEU|nr:prolyl oligopeptidase family serine peptidase [Amycolatopsis saalfeldensis]SEO55701.1 Prolyl oligopeptidase family protein [Amycolatopsis saalfeldensis]
MPADDAPNGPFADLEAYVGLPRLTPGLWLSPDGRRLVVPVSSLDEAGSREITALWEVDPEGGRPPRRLTLGAAGESAAGFTPSGDLLFVSSRSGEPALWLLPAEGGEARLLVSPSGGVRGVSVSGTGTVLLGSGMLPSATDEASDRELRAGRAEAGVTALLHEEFPVRFWNHDIGPARTRLFTGQLTEGELELRDLTGHVGRALDDVCTWEISPDGGTVVTTWAVAEPGGSQRYTLVAIDVATGARRTLADDAAHEYAGPRISPDGTQVAVIVSRRFTPEAPSDCWLGVLPLAGGEVRILASEWDRRPDSACWTPDGSALLTVADDHGRAPLWRVDVTTGAVTRLTADHGAYPDAQVSPDGQWAYASRAAMDSPRIPVRIDLRAAPAAPGDRSAELSGGPAGVSSVGLAGGSSGGRSGGLSGGPSGEPAGGSSGGRMVGLARGSAVEPSGEPAGGSSGGRMVGLARGSAVEPSGEPARESLVGLAGVSSGGLSGGTSVEPSGEPAGESSAGHTVGLARGVSGGRSGGRSGGFEELPSPVAPLELPGRLEEVVTTASDGTEIRGWLVLPEHPAEGGPAPLVVLIHGGPVSSAKAWSWRWSPWLFAARGYAVLLPDFALSTGYGVEFIRRGWGQWGGKPYTDLLTLTDAAQSRPDIDPHRAAAMGASFGGFMANWIATQTGRFSAIISHASMWNLEQQSQTADLAHFFRREMTPETADATSPHQFADAITTPMLITHGVRDYRCPIGEALSLWWALLSRSKAEDGSTPHKFLYFPDEDHFTLAPAHVKLWYETILAFTDHHVRDLPWRRPELLG